MTENTQMQQQLAGELEELKDADLDAVVGGLLGLALGLEFDLLGLAAGGVELEVAV